MAGTTAGAAKARANRAAAPRDRKAPARKRATPRRTLVDGRDPLADLPDAQAETLAEDVDSGVAADGSYGLRFAGDTFRVLPPAEWDKSAVSALRGADFNAWAEAVMGARDAARFAATPMTVVQAGELSEECGLAYQDADPTLLARRPTSSGPTPRR
jgi:hypothetical protein